MVLNSKNRLYNWIFKIIFITDLDSLPKNEKMKERRKGGMKEKKVKKKMKKKWKENFYEDFFIPSRLKGLQATH